MHAPFREVCSRLHAIYAEALHERNRERYSEELWRYYGYLRTPEGCATLTRFMYDLCQLARFDPIDKTILDAGCGFGAPAIVLHLMGAREVHGIDIAEERLTTFQKMIGDFDLKSVHASIASVDSTEFPEDYFDMILSNEAISHYADLDGFLREAARLLKPGGVLLIADGNNGANPRVACLNHRLWERFENGPPGEVDGHRVEKPYLALREEMIHQAFPNLNRELVHDLARRTSYMVRAQVVQAVEHYLTTGEMPDSFFQLERCPIHPESGATMEQHYDPIHLARHIESFGFRARAYAYFGGARGNPLVRLANWIGMQLTPFTLRWTRNFRIVACRQSE